MVNTQMGTTDLLEFPTPNGRKDPSLLKIKAGLEKYKIVIKNKNNKIDAFNLFFRTIFFPNIIYFVYKKNI